MTQARFQHSTEVKTAMNPHVLFASKEEKKPVTSVVEHARQTRELMKAIQQKNHSLMIQTLEKGADPNYSTSMGGSLLMCAVQKKDLETVKILIEHKADINNKGGMYGNTPLHSAACIPDIDLVFYLIEQGADPRIKNNSNSTPIELMKNLEDPVSDDLLEDTLRKRAKELDEADKIERQKLAPYVYRDPSPFD